MKNFLAIFFLIMAVNIQVARADMLPISEVGVNEFVHSIAAVIYSDEFQKEKPLLLTNAVKMKNSNIAKF